MLSLLFMKGDKFIVDGTEFEEGTLRPGVSCVFLYRVDKVMQWYCKFPASNAGIETREDAARWILADMAKKPDLAAQQQVAGA